MHPRLFPEPIARASESGHHWITAFCDGGSRGNPGPAGYGVLVQGPDGATLAELSDYLGRATNNVAEYRALLAALDFALAHGHPRLRVVADSELLVRQIQGRYKVASPDLRPLYDEAKRRIARLDAFRIEHVLRGKNKKADHLANAAMDRGMGRNPAPARPAPASASFESKPDPAPSPQAIVTGSALSIRAAHLDDLPRLTEIYNHYVVHTPVTFDLEPRTVDQRREWFTQFGETGRYRLLVAEERGQIVGYAGTTRFRPKAAYNTTVETTIYCAPEAVGRGIGRQLYSALFRALASEDIHRILAGYVPPNPASAALHQAFGFTVVGIFTQNGYKFGRYWDVCWLERPNPAPPTPGR